MKEIIAQVISVHARSSGDLGKEEHPSIQVELNGIIGDRHRSFIRGTWRGDKQPEGSIRRNERQWSAVSIEELTEIQQKMGIKEPLTAASLGANLCFKGLSKLSQLPKGTLLKFPSGAELMVEEYNPPCHDMGKKLASIHNTTSGKPLATTAFSKAAKLTRGVVGIVEVAGEITAGDEVTIVIYETPSYLPPTS